jgi:hypothetical protein
VGRGYYNFVRPHGGRRFGKVVRTPAMQAGLARRPLTFREVFTWVAGMVRYAATGSGARTRHRAVAHEWPLLSNS